MRCKRSGGIKGLGEIVVGPFFRGVYRAGNGPVSREDYDRQSRMQAEQLLQQRNAIHVYHLEVNECQITGFFLRARQCLLASLCLYNLVTGRL